MGLAYVPLARHPVLGRRPIATALGYALASWAAYQYGVMPRLAPVMNRHVAPVGMAVAHVVFGRAFGGYAARVTATRSVGGGADEVTQSA